MNRTECFGFCPVYHVTLRSDGSITYEGAVYVKHLGIWKAKFDLVRFDDLARTADNVRFSTLKTNPSHAYDVQETTVTVEYHTARHSVHKNGDGPKGLHRLEMQIDSVIKSAYGWKRVKPPKSKWQIQGDHDTTT